MGCNRMSCTDTVGQDKHTDISMLQIERDTDTTNITHNATWTRKPRRLVTRK